MNSVQELIKVSFVGPHGPKVGNQWYRVSKKLSYKFQKDHTYAVEVGVADNGAKYINAVKDDLGGGVAAAESAPSVGALDPNINKAPTPVNDNRPRRAGFGMPLTEYDLRVQAQISIAGLLQAAMGAVATHVANPDALIAESQRVAKAQSAFIKAEVDALFGGGK